MNIPKIIQLILPVSLCVGLAACGGGGGGGGGSNNCSGTINMSVSPGEAFAAQIDTAQNFTVSGANNCPIDNLHLSATNISNYTQSGSCSGDCSTWNASFTPQEFGSGVLSFTASNANTVNINFTVTADLVAEIMSTQSSLRQAQNQPNAPRVVAIKLQNLTAMPIQLNPLQSNLADVQMMMDQKGAYANTCPWQGNLAPHASCQFWMAANAAAKLGQQKGKAILNYNAQGQSHNMSFNINLNTDLYVAGHFTQVSDNQQGTQSVSNIAKWNGQSWQTLPGTNAVINNLTVDDSGHVFAAGDFTQVANTPINHLASWNGQTWNTVSNPMNMASASQTQTLQKVAAQLGQPVTTTATDAATSQIFAGGGFTQPYAYAARFVDQEWLDMQGLNGAVSQFALAGKQLFAAGNFTKPATHLASWNVKNQQWTSLMNNAAVNGTVSTLAVLPQLVVGQEGSKLGS